LLALLLAAGPAPLSPAEFPGRDEIDRLIRQLGSDRFSEREMATATLERIGKPAMPALREARDRAEDAEMRRRARALGRAIERRVHGGEVRCFDSPGNGCPVTGVAFFPNGRRFLASGADRVVRLWNVESGKELLRFTHGAGDGEWVKGVALSPDGR
jgi:hypothetical protein